MISMKYVLTVLLILLGAVSVYASLDRQADNADNKKDKTMDTETKLFQVNDIEMLYLKTNPPQLEIKVAGFASTLGWDNVRLNPFVYVVAPLDGIYEFDFVATPPEGFAAEAIMPVEANFIMQSVPSDLKGIRVYASSNQLEKLLTESIQYAGSDSN
ncbi:hypothetical protein PSSHI_34580 [Photobacterium sp. R1]